MNAEIRPSRGAFWAVCPGCGLAENHHGDITAAEDTVEQHAHRAATSRAATAGPITV
jgi:orotidine-5'-phosphate decarboxylase